MKRTVKILAVLATGLSVALLEQGSVSADGIFACGATVGPGYVQMGADVGPCTGDGLIVASGTILDMQGHVITGDEACSSGGTGVGLKITSDTHILNGGRVEKFRAGVVVDGSLVGKHGDNLIEELDISRNCVHGIDLINTTGNIVRWNTVVFTGNPPTPCDAISLHHSDKNDINANTLSDNGEPASGDAGIRLSSSNDNVVHENGIIRTGGTGGADAAIVISGSGNDVHGNNLHLTLGNGVAIRNVSGVNSYSFNKCESPQTSVPGSLCS